MTDETPTPAPAEKTPPDTQPPATPAPPSPPATPAPPSTPATPAPDSPPAPPNPPVATAQPVVAPPAQPAPAPAQPAPAPVGTADPAYLNYLEQRVRVLESRVLTTHLLDQKFIRRAFAAWGHVFTANIIVVACVYGVMIIIWLVFALIFGMSFAAILGSLPKQ